MSDWNKVKGVCNTCGRSSKPYVSMEAHQRALAINDAEIERLREKCNNLRTEARSWESMCRKQGIAPSASMREPSECFRAKIDLEAVIERLRGDEERTKAVCRAAQQCVDSSEDTTLRTLLRAIVEADRYELPQAIDDAARFLVGG